jgi:hypothetical protein
MVSGNKKPFVLSVGEKTHFVFLKGLNRGNMKNIELYFELLGCFVCLFAEY